MFLQSAKRQDLFKYIRLTMYCSGMYPLNLKNLWPRLELFYEIFLYFVTVHIAILYMFTMYLNYGKGDLEYLVNCLMQTIIYLWTILMKLYFRRLRSKSLTDLMDFMNFRYKLRSAEGFTYVTMDDALDLSNKWIKRYLSCCYLCAIFWLILPITYGDRSLPLMCWYPFDYKKPLIYEMTYFLQMVGQIQVAAAFSASSGFHMVLSILISGQYDILYCSLKNILATVSIRGNTNDRDLKNLRQLYQINAIERNEYYCSRELVCDMNPPNTCETLENHSDFLRNFRKALKECVEHHRYINECLNKMESLYHPVWFLKTGEVILLMCLVAFVSVKSTSTDTSLIKMVSLGQYLLLVAFEMLVICYFGEIIFINSQRCGEAILRSPWFLQIPDIKSELLIFLMNAEKPFRLTAGKIYTLNVELFKGVMMTAFSFLTILQNIDDLDELI